jgi:oxalate decarboxylase/phosphoglucose isomerase-like protein (cupin superfamily)
MNIQDEYPNDAVNIAPHLHTIVFEDDKMRVLKVVVKPGETAEMHWHPRNINYVLSGGSLRFNRPDGTMADVELTEGQVTSAVDESQHAVENIGNTTVETLQVETK